MSISRHFEIVYILLHKKNVTASELADYFEVSTRTIYRDVDTLSAAGIPIYSSRGKGGGISLLNGYVLNTSLLSEQEQEKILMSLQSLTAVKIPDLEGVLNKLSRLFKKERKSWIEVDFSPWGSEFSQRQLFSLFRDAIASNRIIQFRYYNTSGQQSDRSIEPTELLFKNKAWYLTGHCLSSNAYRVFKISRMKDIVMTEQNFEPRQLITFTESEEKSTFNMVNVTLRISAEGAYRVYDEFSESMITQNADGSYNIMSEFPDGNWLESYLLSFGQLIEDVGPEHLRKRILSNLDEIKRKLNRPS